MEWASAVIPFVAWVPLLALFVAAVFAVIVAIAAMVAIWHPDLERREAGYRVLDRLLLALPHAGESPGSTAVQGRKVGRRHKR